MSVGNNHFGEMFFKIWSMAPKIWDYETQHPPEPIDAVTGPDPKNWQKLPWVPLNMIKVRIANLSYEKDRFLEEEAIRLAQTIDDAIVAEILNDPSN